MGNFILHVYIKTLLHFDFHYSNNILRLVYRDISKYFLGFFLITVFSFYMARSQKQNPYKVIAEHVLIAALVVLLAHYIGDIIYEIFPT